MKTETVTEILPGAVYTQQETMAFLRIGWEAFDGIIKRNEIHFSFVGRRRRFCGQDILDYVRGDRPAEGETPKIVSKRSKSNKKRKGGMNATAKALANLKAKGVIK